MIKDRDKYKQDRNKHQQSRYNNTSFKQNGQTINNNVNKVKSLSSIQINLILHPIIQQIYQIDTISLEQQIDNIQMYYFQQQIKQPNQFIRKYLKLAKLQLDQRKNIQLFFFNYDYSNEQKIQTKYNNQTNQKSQFQSIKHKLNQKINKTRQKTQQIFQIKLPKIQIKTNKTPYEKIPLSKKQFLSMMKKKLSQNVVENYKVGKTTSIINIKQQKQLISNNSCSTVLIRKTKSKSVMNLKSFSHVNIQSDRKNSCKNRLQKSSSTTRYIKNQPISSYLQKIIKDKQKSQKTQITKVEKNIKALISQEIYLDQKNMKQTTQTNLKQITEHNIQKQKQNLQNLLLFKQNDDLYDDQPQKFDVQINLIDQQKKLQDQQLINLQSIPNQLQISKEVQQINSHINIMQDQSFFNLQNQQNIITQQIQYLGNQQQQNSIHNQQTQEQQQILQIKEQQQILHIKEVQDKVERNDNRIVKVAQFRIKTKGSIPISAQITTPTKAPIQMNPKQISIPKPLPIYPNYHLMLGHNSFSRLFYGCNSTQVSNSYLNILKNLQTSLTNHFVKNITKLSVQMQRQIVSTLDVDEVQIKLVFIIQNLIKYNYNHKTFQLNQLQNTYKQRAKRLINRIKNIQSTPNQSQQSISYPLAKQQDYMFYRVVKTKQQVYDIVTSSFHRTSQKWLELPHGMDLQACWNLLWTWSKPQINFNQLFVFQKVNHFVNSKQLARKDLLKKNIQKIKRLSKKLDELFDIIPQTFFLPGQNKAFIKKFKQHQNEANNLWILKPVGLSRGRGIQVIKSLSQVKFSQPIVMQKYIQNPLLLGGYKFDLRIYVLVTCINPLQCFVYNQGFARVSTEKYTHQDITNKFIHLTNYSVQKDNMVSPDIFTKQEQQIGGCKLTLAQMQVKLEQMGIKCYKQRIQPEIDALIIKSLVACMQHIAFNPNCFQLFGYDIMLDNCLKCWLIQVNSSPSLQKDFLIDQIIKQQLLDDIIQLICPLQLNRHCLLQIISRRRKQCQGYKSYQKFNNNSTQQFNQDLFRILKGKQVRKYGEGIQHLRWRKLAPSSSYQAVVKVLQTFTKDSIVKQHVRFAHSVSKVIVLYY